MTILSMWNVNYETWRSPYDEASGVADVEGEGEGEGEGMMGVAAAGQELLSTLDTAPNPFSGVPHPPLQVHIGGGGGGGPQSKASKQPSVADTRLRKDRELSVLSKRRIKFMPPQRGSLTVVRTTKVAAQAAVASLGATQGSATATINSATSGTKSVLANTMTTITSGSSDGVKSGTDVPTRKASKSAFLQTEIFFSTKSPALHKNRFIVP